MYDIESQEFQDANAQAKDIFRRKDWQSAAELISGFIDGPQPIPDIWADVIGEYDWTASDARQEFPTPLHVIGGRAMKMENGMTIPVAKVEKGKVGAAPEFLVTPAYSFDVDDLASGDLTNAAEIAEMGAQSLLVEKNIRGLRLATTGVVDSDSGLSVVVKSETSADFISGTNIYNWQQELKNVLDETVAELQDETQGAPVHMVLRTITLQDVKRSGFDLGTVTSHELNASRDPNTGKDMFERGDILLIGKNAMSLAKVQETQADEQHSLFEVRFAFRQGHKWIKWADKGWNSGRIRRVILVDKTPGKAKVKMLNTSGMILSFDKPVKSSSITAASVKVTTEGDPSTNQAGSYTNVTVDGTLTEASITFQTGLTAGTTYVVRVTNSLQDVGGTGMTAGDILTAVVRG